MPRYFATSAKSWLCHAGVDRTKPLLPWAAPPDVPRLSPLDASARYLRHFVDSWNHAHRADHAERLEKQTVVLTVPASGVLGNDYDPNGDPLSVTGHSNPAHGTLSMGSDGGFTYVPTAGYAGPDNAAAVVSGSCRDHAGNGGLPRSYQLKYDSTRPSLTGVTVKAGNGTATLSWAASGGVAVLDPPQSDDRVD